MKIKVLKVFHDAKLNKMTKLGDVLEVTKERAEEMIKAQEDLAEKYIEIIPEVIENTKEKVEKAVVKAKKEKAVKPKKK